MISKLTIDDNSCRIKFTERLAQRLSFVIKASYPIDP